MNIPKQDGQTTKAFQVDNFTQSTGPLDSDNSEQNPKVNPSAKNQKPFLVTAVVVVVLLIIAGSCVLGTKLTTSSPSPENNIGSVDQLPEEPTSGNDNLTPSDVWKSYVDQKAGFKLHYPQNWTLEILSETTKTQTADNIIIAFGQVRLVGTDAMIEIAYGDGFGGAACGAPDGFLASGTLETVSVGSQTVKLCKINTDSLLANLADPQTNLADPPKWSNYKYSWVGSCGDCSGLNSPVESSHTSYVFDIGSNSPNLNNPTITQILESFEIITSPSPMVSPQPTADPTVSWKTYTNSKYGFTFKYPENWDFQELYSKTQSNTIDYLQLTLAKKEYFDPIPKSKPHITINAVETIDRDKLSIYQNTEVVKSITVDGIEAEERKHSTSTVDDTKYVTLTTNNMTYTFESRMSSQDQEQRDIFDQILSTFKFTN